MLAALAACLLIAPRSVTVYRDTYGVPSIVAEDYASASYGLGYACAEDNAERMALSFKQARGRMAEVLGKSQLLADGFLRGLGIEELAREKAKRLSGRQAAILDAYLAGANRAIAVQKGNIPDWIEPFDRVDVLSLTQFANAAFALLDIAGQLMPGTGSNQFAVGPQRSATGHPILSMDPHLDWGGPLFWYEFAVYCPEVKFRGVTFPGLPMPLMGHTDTVAWSMTNNDPDIWDFFIVKNKPGDPTQYSYHGEWKKFEDQSLEMRYLEDGQLKTQTTRSRRTEWGPMVPLRPQAAFLSMLGAWEILDAGEIFGRARKVEDIRGALKLQGISMWNFVTADTTGDILYQYNARVNRRDASIDWTKPVDGSDPKTKLGELVPISELPNVKNPASNLLVNCNSAPWLTPLGKEVSDQWPAYITSYGHTSRYDRLSALLAADKSITVDEAKAYATDTLVPYAEAVVKAVTAVAKPIDQEIVRVLQRWNKRADVSSVGCALYAYWAQDRAVKPILRAAGQGRAWTTEEADNALRSLREAAARLKKDHGSIEVPWGEVHLVKRSGWENPVLGWGGSVGGDTAVAPNTGRFEKGAINCTFGSSWRMVVSLDPAGVQSWSALPFGQSGNPASPHYSDQSAFFGRGEYKATNFGVSGAKSSARKTVRLVAE